MDIKVFRQMLSDLAYDSPRGTTAHKNYSDMVDTLEALNKVYEAAKDTLIAWDGGKWPKPEPLRKAIEELEGKG